MKKLSKSPWSSLEPHPSSSFAPLSASVGGDAAELSPRVRVLLLSLFYILFPCYEVKPRSTVAVPAVLLLQCQYWRNPRQMAALPPRPKATALLKAAF